VSVEELIENWKRACRSDELMRRYPEPEDQSGLAAHVLARVRGATQPPDTIIVGAAIGFASSEYASSGEAKYLQLAALVREAAKDPNADLRSAVEVLALVGQAAVSLLVSTWRGEAEVDGLTRLGNRRKMEALVTTLSESGTRFAYASADADGLKQINDDPAQGGHAAGDAFLRDLGDELRRAAEDVQGEAFRYGGDEFGIVVAIGDGDETLTAAIAAAQERVGQRGRSFSAGVSVWPDVDLDTSTVIDTADRLMYDQKKAKKAAQLTAPSADPPPTPTAE
jgi:diguanylate cyclase (GGDEF)-like protein